ncbi:hypothetical protein [Frigoribacterium sp. CFBP 8754]|nr:hypothetical protein [Frigoribacterium sp. CFBP 8754]
MIVTIVLLVATVAAVQLIGDAAVRATSPEPVPRRRWWRRRSDGPTPVAVTAVTAV